MSAPNWCNPCGFYHPREYDCDSSRERDRAETRRLADNRAAWLDGYAAGLHARGFPRYARHLKLDAPSLAELEARRWGPGGRASFGAPRPGDRHPVPRGEAA